MYDEILKLIGFDRLMEADGDALLREIAKRQASRRALLGASGAGADDGSASVLHESTAVAPTDDYLSLVLGDGGFADGDAQPVSLGPGSAQLHIGRHLMRARRRAADNEREVELGTAHVSVVDADEQPPRWRERFVVDDLAAWLGGEVAIRYDVDTPPGWKKPEESEQYAIESFGQALREGVGPRWSMTMTYRYLIPLGEDEIKSLLTAAAAMAAPPKRWLFDVISGVAGQGSQMSKGWMLREAFGSESHPALIVEHWRLPKDWKPVVPNRPLKIMPRLSDSRPLETFFELSETVDEGWYVRGIYTVEKTPYPKPATDPV